MDIEAIGTDMTVVRLSGRLDSSTSGDVMDQLNAVVEKMSTRIVLNLENVTFMSSAGLRSILVAAKLAQSSGGQMRMCCPRPLVSEILINSGFSNIIHIDTSEEQAIASLRRD